MKIEQLKEYFKEAESDKIAFTGKCHDCGVDVAVECDITSDSQINVRGGAVYKPVLNGEYDRLFLKCEYCYDKLSRLENYNPCEVYSRVVGYLRPTNQWNKGKVAEWKDRKEFKL